MSGLAAAVRLLEQRPDLRVTLLEARREAGGRTRSYQDPTTGDTLDNGQHLLMGCYTSTLSFLETIGTSRELERIPLRIPFWSRTGVRSFTLDQSLPPPLHLLSAIARTSLLSFSEKRAAAELGNALRRNKQPTELSSMTCAELFRAHRQPAGLVTTLWEPIVLATLNARVEEASAELFVNVLKEAFFTTRAASSLLFPKVGLSELLVDPALAYLTVRGAEIRLGEPVRSITEGTSGVTLMTDRGDITADAVILAAPQSDLMGETMGVQTTTYSPIANAYFWVDREILKAPIHAFLGTTLQWAFPKPTTYAAQRIALTVSAADGLAELTNEALRDRLWAELQELVPAAREATLVHAQIIREKRATPLLGPEANSTRPALRSIIDPLRERIVIAGDLVQNGLPATIEGAVRNGHAAAEALLAS